MMKRVFVCWARRTPIGSFGGIFKNVSAIDLGRLVLARMLSEVEAAQYATDIFVGNVLSAGLGQAPAKQILLRAGFSEQVQATTVNKVCSSSMEAMRLGWLTINAGVSDCVIVGGVESMSQAPFLLMNHRFGKKFGEDKILDHLFHDGLINPYDQLSMGQCCERGITVHGLSREVQDDYAILSYKRAQDATSQGAFRNEIVPITVDESEKNADEEPFKADFSKLKQLKPAFEPKGTITAANASKISDGACFALMVSEDFLKKHNLEPLAEVLAFGRAATNPRDFYLAPSQAIRNVCDFVGLRTRDVKIFEVNEAFAAVPLIAHKELDLPLDILNIRGGAVSLGHPLGASGLRIVVTLIYIMRDFNLEIGCAAICNGGGEAVSVLMRKPK